MTAVSGRTSGTSVLFWTMRISSASHIARSQLSKNKSAAIALLRSDKLSGQPLEKTVWRLSLSSGCRYGMVFLLGLIHGRYASNYLADAGKPERQLHKLMIPNREVKKIYENRILSWFRVRTVSDTAVWKKFCESVKTGDVPQMQKLLNGLDLWRTLSASGTPS